MRGCANTSTFHPNTMHLCFHKEVIHLQICLYAIRGCTNTISFHHQQFWSACVIIVRKPSLWKPLRQCHHTTPGESTTEACSNESSSTERTRWSHCEQIYHRSLFQRKQVYWTHSMVPLRTSAICCSWQPTITTHSTKLWLRKTSRTHRPTTHCGG